MVHQITTILDVMDDDLPFLWDLLRAASDDAGLLPVNATSLTSAHEVQSTLFGMYLAGWGRLGDAGVVAWDTMGAASARLGATSSSRYILAMDLWRPMCPSSRLGSWRGLVGRVLATPCCAD